MIIAKMCGTDGHLICWIEVADVYHIAPEILGLLCVLTVGAALHNQISSRRSAYLGNYLTGSIENLAVLDGQVLLCFHQVSSEVAVCQ